jgi:hypothetical protein
MARLCIVQPEEATGEVARLFEGATNLMGRVPNAVRVMANSPLVAKFLIPFIAVCQREGGGSVLSTKLKEMVVIKTSHLNGCEY